MTRRTRPGPSRPADPGGASHAPFDGLAALRGTLRQKRVFGRTIETSAGSPPKAPLDTAPSLPLQEAPDASDSGLLQAALQGVRPLSAARQRAEIEIPKPAPVPRARQTGAEDDAPTPSRRRPAPSDGNELFRYAVEDVTPLAHENRAEIGIDRRLAQRRDRHPGAPRPADENLLLLPPDADHTDPTELFRYAVRGARPVDARNRAELDVPQARPQPLKHLEDEREALRESLEAPMTLEDRLETGEEAAFLRPGLPRRVLTDLRRGRWVLQAQVDLHGHNRDEARDELSRFLAVSLAHGHRCVRVIHGKGHGSPGKESILKKLSRGWLAQREEILAFCQAGPHDGGSGALLVLLRAGNPPRT